MKFISGFPPFPPFPSVRQQLAANKDYYVRVDGNDANDGSANDAAHAFLTIQKAVAVSEGLDLNGFIVFIHVADGTYTNEIIHSFDPPGAGTDSIQIIGNVAHPENVIIHCVNTCLRAVVSCINIQHVTLQSDAGFGLYSHDKGRISFNNVRFGACVIHMYAEAAGRIVADGNYSVFAGGVYHIAGVEFGNVVTSGRTVQFNNIVMIFAAAFCYTTNISDAYADTMIFLLAGGVTGKRYQSDINSVIYTSGGGANYFPGNVPGTTAAGGQYV